MNRIFRDARYKTAYRHNGHAFVPKETNRPVQTADVLAWHHVQEARRQSDGRPLRQDFEELLRDQNERYKVVHTQREMFDDVAFMQQFRDFIAEPSQAQRRRDREG